MNGIKYIDYQFTFLRLNPFISVQGVEGIYPVIRTGPVLLLGEHENGNGGRGRGRDGGVLDRRVDGRVLYYGYGRLGGDQPVVVRDVA